jgi:hypothetical protein
MQLSYYIHNNPVRAGIVKRLIDYRWSSYPAYAYNRRHPKWLDKDLILSQIHGENKHRQYRDKSQKYSDENRRMYTNLQIGDLFGLTHSSVSRRVTIIRKKMALEQNFQRQVEAIKSQIKP